MATTTTHPWECHLSVRGRFKKSPMDQPDCYPPPRNFAKKAAIRGPDAGRAKTHRECVTLADVVAFRTRHPQGGSQSLPAPRPDTDDEDEYEIIDMVTDAVGAMRLAPPPGAEVAPRPILYRSTGATKDKGEWTVLEACHFEVFMPDRKDLRFVVVPSLLMSEKQCVEGHLFAVFEMQLLPRRLPSLMLQAQYPILWSACRFERLDSAAGTPYQDMIYIAKVMDSGDARAVCNWSPSYITVHSKRFYSSVKDEHFTENEMYEAVMVDTSSAWIYPVEPPKNKVEYAKLVATVRSSSMNTGVFAEKIQPLPYVMQDMIERRMRLELIPEQLLLSLFELGIRYRELSCPKETVNVLVKSIDPPELIVFSEVYAIDYVSLLLLKKGENVDKDVEKISKLFLTVNSISHPRRGNNQQSTLKCSPHPRLAKEFPNFAAMQAAKEFPRCTAILESTTRENITLQSLELIETRLEEIKNPIGRRPAPTDIALAPPPLYEYLYGKVERPSLPPYYLPSIRRGDGRPFSPNERQALALSLYHGMNVPAFCILSPPGSGKTTVAAAMAASLVDNRAVFKPGDVQLLLAVQNVAVENLAVSLKSFDANRLRAYYAKSLLRTDAESKAPYDIKALLPNYRTFMVNAEDGDMNTMRKYFELDEELKQAKEDPSKRLSNRQRFKKTFEWHKMLRKAKLTLEKYLQPQIVLCTVDLALCYLQNNNQRGIKRMLQCVTRIVIDEASLLTESTFYALVRLFPRASFVLIGDNKQLPPFLFDETVTGHRLTARSALTVALANGNIPSIQLLEVYRAPPTLVEPYNKLSYEGQLVSRKREECFPLSSVKLLDPGKPQLLLIANTGSHSAGSSKSVWNSSEIETLLGLLQLFPDEYKNQIMIICLYKEQRKQLETLLGTNYELHTVDSAQGKEKPIVILLTTRSDKRTPFFASAERCTVAVSRQQQALIIIGNQNLLSGTNPSPWPWSIVLESAQFTIMPATELPPVEEEIKQTLRKNLVADESNDVTDIPAPQPYTLFDAIEAAAQDKQEHKEKKKEKNKTTE